MSIVRVGMAEDNKFANGWDAIFNKKGGAKKPAEEKPPAEKAEAKPAEKPAKKK